VEAYESQQEYDRSNLIHLGENGITPAEGETVCMCDTPAEGTDKNGAPHANRTLALAPSPD